MNIKIYNLNYNYKLTNNNKLLIIIYNNKKIK